MSLGGGQNKLRQNLGGLGHAPPEKFENLGVNVLNYG